MKSHLLGAVCVYALVFGLVPQAHAVAVSGQGTWETALQGRDLDGNATTFEAYYDTVLDITWLADANINGQDTWINQVAWVSSLNINGVSGWRLPRVSPVDGGTSFNTSFSSNNGTTDIGYNLGAPGTPNAGSTVSEMAYMFYNHLGNIGLCSPDNIDPASCNVPDGWGLTNAGPFLNIVTTGQRYWSGSELVPVTGDIMDFVFDNGGQGTTSGTTESSNTSYAWAVHDGDIGAVVPLPATVWLFGSGLIGLVGVARRKTVQ